MIGSFVRYQDGRIVTFNAPGQGTGPTSGTWAMGLNDQGDTTGVTFQQIYGFYQNSIRKADGSFIIFPQPGLCATQVDNGCMGWGASQINDLGMVAGSYLDDNRVYQSFIRYPDGRMEIFAAPGATSLSGSYGGTTLDIGVASVLNQPGASNRHLFGRPWRHSWICTLAKMRSTFYENDNAAQCDSRGSILDGDGYSAVRSRRRRRLVERKASPNG